MKKLTFLGLFLIIGSNLSANFGILNYLKNNKLATTTMGSFGSFAATAAYSYTQNPNFIHDTTKLATNTGRTTYNFLQEGSVRSAASYLFNTAIQHPKETFLAFSGLTLAWTSTWLLARKLFAKKEPITTSSNDPYHHTRKFLQSQTLVRPSTSSSENTLHTTSPNSLNNDEKKDPEKNLNAPPSQALEGSTNTNVSDNPITSSSPLTHTSSLLASRESEAQGSSENNQFFGAQSEKTEWIYVQVIGGSFYQSTKSRYGIPYDDKKFLTVKYITDYLMEHHQMAGCKLRVTQNSKDLNDDELVDPACNTMVIVCHTTPPAKVVAPSPSAISATSSAEEKSNNKSKITLPKIILQKKADQFSSLSKEHASWNGNRKESQTHILFVNSRKKRLKSTFISNLHLKFKEVAEFTTLTRSHNFSSLLYPDENNLRILDCTNANKEQILQKLRRWKRAISYSNTPFFWIISLPETMKNNTLLATYCKSNYSDEDFNSTAVNSLHNAQGNKITYISCQNESELALLYMEAQHTFKKNLSFIQPSQINSLWNKLDTIETIIINEFASTLARDEKNYDILATRMKKRVIILEKARYQKPKEHQFESILFNSQEELNNFMKHKTIKQTKNQTVLKNYTGSSIIKSENSEDKEEIKNILIAKIKSVNDGQPILVNLSSYPADSLKEIKAAIKKETYAATVIFLEILNSSSISQ